jgi:NodT family efflux transporter outer membrane factor (OMF) lipoprotein
MTRSLALFLLLTLSAAVRAQGNYDEKLLRVALPEGWYEGSGGVVYSSGSPADDKWWTVLGDTLLNKLVAEAMENNYSLMTAVNRVELARYTLRQTRAELMPTVGLSAGWTKEQSSGSITSEERAREYYFSSGLSASWEVDLFGSIRRRVKADKAALMADRETHASVMVSLAAQVATAYINLREAQQTLRVIERNCESQRATVLITEARFNAGLVSKLDVAQARSVYYSTKASLPQTETTISTQIAALAVLLGTYPEMLRERLQGDVPMPDYVEPVTIGVPVDLLRRRPDVRSAERQLRSKEYLLKASRSDLLPSLSLSASAGYSAKSMKRLFHEKSLTYELAPTLSWTLFNGGKSLSAVGMARVEMREALEQFNQTVLTAMQEADNAICAYSNSVREMVAMREVCVHGRESLALSLELYKQGLSPFQNVLDAQRSLLSYESELVQSHGSSLVQLIALYKALGGGWIQ